VEIVLAITAIAALTSVLLTCVMWQLLLRSWGNEPAVNTTTNAIAVTLLMIACANLDQVLTDIGPLVNLLPLVAAGLFARYRYRLTFWRGVAVAFVVTLWMAIAQFALGIATAVLWHAHPALAVLPAAVVILTVLLKRRSAKSLRERMEAVR
jgi:hypothetical protein